MNSQNERQNQDEPQDQEPELAHDFQAFPRRKFTGAMALAGIGLYAKRTAAQARPEPMPPSSKVQEINMTSKQLVNYPNPANTPDQALGNGGEIHQLANSAHPPMSGQTGVIIADDENQLRGGERGPSLLEDQNYLTKTQHFDHERIPERVVHARGFGAHGYFELTDSLQGISRAAIFHETGTKTPVFVRFSTVAGNKGSTDLARDVRGFAVKFYTSEGNWDLVGNNIPVFLFRMPSSSPT